ncbi:MAG: plasmid pRiA4b ORF-3 family protein [Nitrococcus mobilis]|nr:plasmid pRiA4b ORF-3 family protein [Nitrococcus mobilis]
MADKSKPNVYQIKVTLMGSRPPIWRRILAPSNMPLPKFHELLQIAMGWENAHLHQFIAGKQYLGVPDPGFPSEVKNEARVKLQELLPAEGSSAIYEYDFGDGWQHKLVLEKVRPYEEGEPLPRCLEGKRACPPEDCGGIGGYEHLLEAVSDSKHPEHEELSEWLEEGFDPEHFDASQANFELGRCFGKSRRSRA